MATVEIGTRADIDELEQLYSDLCDALARGVNYPGWKKGIYPDRETAVQGVEEKSLYVARSGGRIAGTVILRHEQEAGYKKADWHVDLTDQEICVVHTLAVHPGFQSKGVGTKLLDFIVELSVKEKRKAIRLDVYEKNTPAMRFYERRGFEYIDTVDLGYGSYGLDWFALYQRRL